MSLFLECGRSGLCFMFLYCSELPSSIFKSRSLYVKNLNFKSTAESLRKHISENMKGGKILSVKILQHVKKGKNFSTGFGFIEFDSVETAANACRDLKLTNPSDVLPPILGASVYNFSVVVICNFKLICPSVLILPYT